MASQLIIKTIANKIKLMHIMLKRLLLIRWGRARQELITKTAAAGFDPESELHIGKRTI